ncbi:hypothetical protein C1H46_014883 [Malus baccata]|uniref:Mitochondrial inner membrane protease ATP23 n=1 Tax=Malus baccata TaxID=106549 RepID=A0A540ML76_MALBA|nr:hypothetical protein C1H46_014883 [Malus baccata]
MEAEPAPEPGSTSFPSAVNGGKTLEECQTMIQRSLRTPMVKFLLKHLEQSGCGIGDRFIKAINCNKQIAGGYIRGEGILVCSNHMTMQDDVNQVVIHELIHAFDDCRAKNLEWSNCAHHACSEIRAGHLSGDCHYKRELLRGFVKIRGHEQDCVRRRVMKSVISNPYCSEAAAKDAMEAVWDVYLEGALAVAWGCRALEGFLKLEGEGEGLVPDVGDAAGLVDFLGFLGFLKLEGELAGADLGDDDGADLGEEDGEDDEDVGDGAGAEDGDLVAPDGDGVLSLDGALAVAGPLAGDDAGALDGELDGADPGDGDAAGAFAFLAETPAIMTTKMRVRTTT